MARFILGRTLILIASVLVASLVVFLAIEVAPGDPARTMLGLNASPETVAALKAELGLNLPGWARYLHWITGFFTGDMGVSYAYRRPVAGLIWDRLAVSAPLALMALALTVAIAFPTGLVAAARRGRAADAALMGAAQVGVAVPNFWFAMILITFLALKAHLFPAGGFPGWGDPVAAIRALILPAIALALPQAAILARVLRSALIETMGQDYIRTARAKGRTRAGALLAHALRNAMIPVMTIVAMQVSVLLAGAIIIENVFALPGLGRLIFQAIAGRDLITVESSVMLLVMVVIAVSYLTDLAYAWIDPRLGGGA